MTDHDGGYTYIDAITGDSMPLMPFMIKEWACMMVSALYILSIIASLHGLQYDRITSSSNPPLTQTFDPINRRSSVTPHHHSASATTMCHVPLLEESALTSVSQILFSFTSIAQMQSFHPSLPTTPIHSQDLLSTAHSLITNMPSKLHRFLLYAETHLSVPNVRLYEQCLDEMRYAPDILHLIDDFSLRDIGIKPGDVIHLKQNLLQWLNSFGLKCKQGDQAPSAPSTPPSKQICFEKQFHNGGASWVYGWQIVEAKGDVLVDLSFNWSYFCVVSPPVLQCTR